jgi:hypothetical protein
MLLPLLALLLLPPPPACWRQACLRQDAAACCCMLRTEVRGWRHTLPFGKRCRDATAIGCVDGAAVSAAAWACAGRTLRAEQDKWLRRCAWGDARKASAGRCEVVKARVRV